MYATPFTKRIYNVPLFLTHMREIMNHTEDIRDASRAGRVSKPFREKIMLAVTHVNGCRWCNYGHTRAALREGVSEDELHHLLEGEFAMLPEGEVVALVFAQHYADLIHTHVPDCIVGAYMCPWTPDEFDGALTRIFAQDYALLAPAIDVFTPLIYGKKSGRSADWGREFLERARTFIPKESKVQLILDVLDFPGSLVATGASPIPQPNG